MNAHSRFGVIGVTIALILGMAVVSVGAVDLKEGIEQLAVQLGKAIPEGRTLRVAVTDFADLQGVVLTLAAISLSASRPGSVPRPKSFGSSSGGVWGRCSESYASACPTWWTPTRQSSWGRCSV
jgi:hypothetical protein